MIYLLPLQLQTDNDDDNDNNICPGQEQLVWIYFLIKEMKTVISSNHLKNLEEEKNEEEINSQKSHQKH